MSTTSSRNGSSTPTGPSRLHLPHGTTPTLDAALWGVAIMVAAAVIAQPGGVHVRLATAASMLSAAVLQVLMYLFFLRGRVRFATTDEFPRILLSDLVITVVLMGAGSPGIDLLLPSSTCLVAGSIALFFHLLARWAFGKLLEIRHRPAVARARRTIVLGAGYGGEQAIRIMLEDGESSFYPVAILDDDPAKRHLRISSVRVVGRWDDLEEVARNTHADLVLLAVPSASAEAVDRVATRARNAGLEIRVMPSASELLARVPSRSSSAQSALSYSTQVFRPLQMEDLLGRREIHTNVEEIGSYLTGQRILVTGAGGSIGSQLCREIAKYDPERLIMVDRDESALHAVQLSLYGEPRLDDSNLVLGDLRTPGFIDALFDETHPGIVFHAAALKHLTLTERFPEEAFLTNVAVTRDLLLAAARTGTERFINISTDKAANPTSILGYSKRIAERLTSSVGLSLSNRERHFMSVRFGNVLGSRGSALVTFSAQLEQGLPLTITDPRMERFFMSVDEACQLVLQAGVLGRSGEALVLDMGKPHNIESIARRFAKIMGYPNAAVVYTGASEGEKMTEDLFSSYEVNTPSSHDLISKVSVPPLADESLSSITQLRAEVEWSQHGELVVPWMEALAHEGSPRPSSSPRGEAA